MDRVTLIGLDPGLANFGVSRVLTGVGGQLLTYEATVISTEQSDAKLNVLSSADIVRRARYLAAKLGMFITASKNPRVLCVEAMSFPRSSSSAAKLAMSWGVVATLAERYNLPICQATPQQIKKALTGEKSASKKQVQAGVEEWLFANKMPPLEKALPAAKGKWEHAVDSLAAIRTCWPADIVQAVLVSPDHVEPLCDQCGLPEYAGAHDPGPGHSFIRRRGDHV